MDVRICSKVACGAGASATLTYDYADSMVVVGPLSDRFGRRRPLLIGILIYIAASILCAASPSVTTAGGAHTLACRSLLHRFSPGPRNRSVSSAAHIRNQRV